MTNRGLKIKLRAKPFTRNVYLVQLICSKDVVAGPANPLDSYRYAMILLRRRFEDDQYARVSIEGQSMFHEFGYDWQLDKVNTFKINANVRQIQAHDSAYDRESALDVLPGFVISRNSGVSFQAREARMLTLDENRYFIKMSSRSKSGVAGEITIHRDDGPSEIRLTVGHDLGFNPVCYISCPQKGSDDRTSDRILDQMYQCNSWSPRLVNNAVKGEFNEWREGTGT